MRRKGGRGGGRGLSEIRHYHQSPPLETITVATSLLHPCQHTHRRSVIPNPRWHKPYTVHPRNPSEVNKRTRGRKRKKRKRKERVSCVCVCVLCTRVGMGMGMGAWVGMGMYVLHTHTFIYHIHIDTIKCYTKDT
jgi:hypothetical protein